MKVYIFMWYQSFREMKNFGGNKAAIKEGHYFDIPDYEKVLAEFGATGVTGTVPSPTQGLGPSSFSIYRAVMKKIYKSQITHQGVLNCHWDTIWQQGFEAMEEHVKGRAPRGGVHGRNEKFGLKWRKHIDGQHYSRMKRIVHAITQYSKQNSVTTATAAAELDAAYQNCNRSIAKMVKYC